MRRHVLHDVDLAGEERGEPGAELRDEPERHRLQLGLALPVVVVAHDDQLLVAHPLAELEWPGADRLGEEPLRAFRLQRLGRHHQHVAQRDAVDEPRPGLLGDEAHRVGVDDLDLLHEGPARRVVRLVGRVLDVVHRRLDALGVEGLAVVELHARAQRELPRRVVHDLPGGGQHGDRLVGLGVPVHQPVVHVLDHVVGGPVHDGVRQERARLGGEGDHDLLGLHAALRRGRKRRGQERREHHEEFQKSHQRVLLVPRVS